MSILDKLKAGFSMAVPASREVREKIAEGVLVHRTRLQYVEKIIKGVVRKPDDFANCEIRLTGDFGRSPVEMMRATLRDYRIIDPEPFKGTGDRGFTDFVYFFLGEPETWQVESQNFGGSGDFATIRVRGKDLLADPRRRIFYRRGLFWEADRAVVVKGGYEGPAKVEPLTVTLKAPFV